MTTKKARENKGKLVSVRPGPSVWSGWKRFLLPRHTVEYIDIVPDSKFPDRKWLKLSENNYVNYDYPPAGIRYILLDEVIEFDRIKLIYLTEDGVVVSEREFYDTRPTA